MFELGSAAARGVHTGALLTAFGTLMFVAVVLRRSEADGALMGRLERLARGSVMMALGAGLAWLVLRASLIAEARGVAEALAATPVVAGQTQFGRILLGRLGLLAILVLMPRGGVAPRIGIAGVALALQGWLSHAGAADGAAGRDLLVAETVHVLAAGAWLGSLLPLLTSLRGATPALRQAMLRRYFPLGLIAVLLIGLTSVAQGKVLVGSLPGLVGTAYGHFVLMKTGLLAGLLVCAALNRFVLGGRIAGLRRSVASEAGLGGMLVLAAAMLAQVTPGAHDRPVWPFAWRLDPRDGAAGLMAATPASYFVSPSGFSAEAIVRGERRFRAECASCHGAAGHGDGAAGALLANRPADLTARAIGEYGDGDLFWRAGHTATQAGRLDDEGRWDVVDYIRALNRGAFLRVAGRASAPVRVPGFAAVCGDGEALGAEAMRGRVIRIVMPGRGAMRIEPEAQVLGGGGGPVCVAAPDTAHAIAILLGTTREALAGSEFLVDPNGWMRARWRPGQPGGWPTADRLMARVQVLAENPLPADPGAAHVHPQ